MVKRGLERDGFYTIDELVVNLDSDDQSQNIVVEVEEG